MTDQNNQPSTSQSAQMQVQAQAAVAALPEEERFSIVPHWLRARKKGFEALEFAGGIYITAVWVKTALYGVNTVSAAWAGAAAATGFGAKLALAGSLAWGGLAIAGGAYGAYLFHGFILKPNPVYQKLMAPVQGKIAAVKRQAGEKVAQIGLKIFQKYHKPTPGAGDDETLPPAALADHLPDHKEAAEEPARTPLSALPGLTLCFNCKKAIDAGKEPSGNDAKAAPAADRKPPVAIVGGQGPGI